MSLFKKRSATPAQEQIAERIAVQVMIWQRWLATYLNKKIGKYSPPIMRYWLIGLSLFTAGYCLYLVIGALR